MNKMTKGTSSRSSSSSSSSGGEQLNNSNKNPRYKRIKLDSSSELEESASSSEIVSIPSLFTNMKTQAAFVNKLYKMLEDPDTTELISWSSHGDLFSVSNPTTFSKTVLPQYFKHNNWQSFVRQLNMYGFHKVNDLIHSNLTNENQTWEFKHPNFRRGAVGDLQYIKRKSAKSQQLLLQQHQQQQAQQQAQQQQQQQQQQAQQAQQEQDMQDYHDQIQQQQEQNEQALSKYKEEKEVQSNAIIKHIMQIEDNIMGVSKTCEQLFNEVVHLKMIVSKQQDAMQDLVDVVSSSAKNNGCNCMNGNNNNSDNNKKDLQNAENLRIQVSKLKENQNNYDNDNNNNNNNKRKMSSYDSMKQPYPYNSSTSDTFTDYPNGDSSETSSTIFDRKSSDSSKSPVQSYGTNAEENKARSSKMSFGKQSHMLNPMEDQQARDAEEVS